MRNFLGKEKIDTFQYNIRKRSYETSVSLSLSLGKYRDSCNDDDTN